MEHTSAFAVFAVLSVVFSSVGGAAANPCMPPLIAVDSPQNNHVYASNSVALNFSALPNSGYNFSSFSYILDGAAKQPVTDCYVLLTGLLSGSHTLKIYGNGTWHDLNDYNDMLLETVYFNVNYSPALLTLTIVSSAFVLFIILVVFVNRKPLTARLKRKKTAGFWVGLTCFLGSSLAFFVPSAYWYACEYVYPYFHRGFIVPPFPSLVFGLVFMGVGGVLMAVGTRQKKAS